ncbi:MAG: hypothetical protein WAL42_00565, partial [Nitrososphaeraceae archaeon]
ISRSLSVLCYFGWNILLAKLTSINSLQKMSSLTIEGFLIVISSSNSLLWYWSFPSVQPYDN